MPSNLYALDSDLPSFNGKESPQEQNRKMFDYLVQMKQSLQYCLRNLTADNFNASAFEQLSDSAKEKVSKTLELMQSAVTELSGKVDGLSARVSSVDGLSAQITALEENDDLLAAEIAGVQETMDTLAQAVYGENGILTRLDTIEKKLVIIQIGEDGSATIGADGLPLRLVGQLYINGVPYEGGEST